jgi:hypothetical protein
MPRVCWNLLIGLAIVVIGIPFFLYKFVQALGSSF